MAARPTPHSIALSALIALHCESDSPLYASDEQGHVPVDAFLHKILTAPQDPDYWTRTRAPPIGRLLHGLQVAAGQPIADALADWLQIAATSINALTDLMNSINRAVREGLVDSNSIQGIFIRSVCLGFDELSFESTCLLWKNFQHEMENLATEIEDMLPVEEQWPLPPEEMEAALRNECIETRPSGLSLHDVSDGIARVAEKNSKLPSIHFLNFLNCIQTGERIGAMEALHQYFDYALIHSDSTDDRKELLQFAAILLAAMHHQAGDAIFSRLATDEAVRVAQQSQDTACVAFALGWLFENEIAGSAKAGELIRRCSQRALEGNLRPLVAGANLSQVRHSLTSGRVEGDHSATIAWTHLMAASTDPPSAESSSHLDRPTHMTHIASGDQALEILARQRMVAAAIWEAFGQTASSGLSSYIALYCHADQILPVDVMTAVQNIARVSLFGSPSVVLLPEALQSGALYKYYSDLLEGVSGTKQTTNCIYADSLLKLVRLRKVFHLPVKGVFTQEISLILHEWAVRRGDWNHAHALMLLLQSNLRRGMANYVEATVDVCSQKCLLLCGEKRWDEAKAILKSQMQKCKQAGLREQQARLLLQLATVHLDSTTDQFEGALPSLLDCLTSCDKYEMYGIHATALSILAQVLLRMHNTKQAMAVLQASLPTILQQEHVWFQAEAFLTIAKCHLMRAKEEGKEGRVVSKKILQSARVNLSRSEELFTRCQDGRRLREIYYLQARLLNSLPNHKSQRDNASKKFLEVSSHLSRTMAPTSDGFLSALSSDDEVERLASRCFPPTPSVA